MCDECWSDDPFMGEPVTLERRYPKNKADNPADWLIGYDVARGHYDLVDKSSVQLDNGNYRAPVVGYFTTYRGSINRNYSQPMFTLKDAADSCSYCVSYPADENHPAEVFYANVGCTCGNIAYMTDCPEHPTPKANSRWVRLQQAGDSRCNNCDVRLEPHGETFSEDWRFYCSDACNKAWQEQYECRKAEWNKRA